MTTAGFSDAFVVGGEFNVTPLAPVNGQKVPLQVDASGNLLVNVNSTITASENLAQVGGAAISLGAKTSAASIPVVLASDEAALPVIGKNTAVSTVALSSATSTGTVLDLNVAGYSSVALTVVSSGGTFSAGQIDFRGGVVGSGNVSHLTGMRESKDVQQLYDATDSLSFAPSQNVTYWFNVAGLTDFLLILQVAIVGTGTVSISVQAVAGSGPGPTTVGQSDATKLNATTVGASGAITSATWTSATAGGTQISVPCLGYSTVAVRLSTNSGTFTGGTINFYTFVAGSSTYLNVTGMRQLNLSEQLYDANKGFSPTTPNQDWLYYFNVGAADSFIIYLQNAITGTGTVSINVRPAQVTMPGPTTVGQSDPTKLNATS